MVSAMPASTLCSRPWPSHSQPSSAYAVASSSPPVASWRISRREASCRPETGSTVVLSACPMRPTAVNPATAWASATPTPLVTTVLANSWPASAPGSLVTGTASPVSSDSLTSR